MKGLKAISFRILIILLLTLTVGRTARATQTGSCGAQVYYELDDNGVLRIYGTGDMTDYGYDAGTGVCSSPFSAFADNIRKVVIESGVTSIGEYSLADCGEITEVSLPGSLERIEHFAFWNCERLQAVSIPSGVMHIGAYAFVNCKAISAYDVSEDNPYFKDDDGVLFNKAGTRLIRYPSARQGAYVISDTVDELYYNAFEGTAGLTDVTIPDNHLAMAPHAFENCTGLTSVTIPGSAGSIEAYVFCGCTGLREVHIGEGVEFIGEKAFSGVEHLPFIELPAGVTSIGPSAFEYCRDLRSIIIPETVTDFAEHIFNDCMTWLTVYGTAGSPAQIYAENDFWLEFLAVDGMCGENVHWSLDPENGELWIYGTGPMFDSSDYATNLSPFAGNTDITSVTFIDGVTGVGEAAFIGCTGINELELPRTLESIGGAAFRNCSSLTDLYIPASTKLLDQKAFDGCTSIIKIYFAGDRSVAMSFGKDVYPKNDNMTIFCRLGTMAYIDARRREIRYYLVDPFSKPDLELPRNLTSIGEEAFAGLSVRYIYIDDSVKTIGSRAFADNMMLEKIAIPDEITFIADDAFDGCRSDLMLYGHRGTLVETYAREKGFLFALMPVG